MQDVTQAAPRRRFARVVANLAVANSVTLLASLLTGPLQARALGPSDRGLLAAIAVPLTLIPQIAQIGLSAFAGREVARGEPVRAVAASVGAVLVGIGMVGVIIGFPLSRFLGDGRDTVELFLVVGFAVLPISLLGLMLVAMAAGLEQWGSVIASKAGPSLFGLASIAILYAVGELTLVTAAIVALASGIFAILPVIGVLRGTGAFRVKREYIARGVPFGLKASVGVLMTLVNFRLDQLLMIRLVEPRELGLYAVAATLAGISGSLTGAISGAAFTRVASGTPELATKSVRFSLASVGLVNFAIAIATPLAVPLFFGRDFGDAVPMALILLVAGAPTSAAAVLAAVLVGDGRPGAPAMAEACGLLITVAGLLVLLPVLGGIGAALVSLAAYSTVLTALALIARKHFRTPIRAFLVPTRDDIGEVRRGLSTLIRRLTRTVRPGTAGE